MRCYLFVSDEKKPWISKVYTRTGYWVRKEDILPSDDLIIVNGVKSAISYIRDHKVEQSVPTGFGSIMLQPTWDDNGNTLQKKAG